jgi:hypothetical protein
MYPTSKTFVNSYLANEEARMPYLLLSQKPFVKMHKISCSVSCCTVLLKKDICSLVIRQVFKKLSECV